MPSPLVIADDNVADRIFGGDFSTAVVEAPALHGGAFASAVRSVRTTIGKDIGICLTLKSKFCRPNLDQCAEALAAVRGNVEAAAVASIEDAIALRLRGVTQRLILLYAHDPSLAPLFAKYQLEPAAASAWWVREVRRRTDGVVSMHLWVDTGMGREGVPIDEAVAVAGEMKKGQLAGIATHFAGVPYTYPNGSPEWNAGPDADAFTDAQCNRFDRVREQLARVGYAAPAHAASSGAIQRGLRQTFYDMVRPGRLVSEQVGRAFRSSIAVRTTVHTAKVACVKQLTAGWRIGYFDRDPLHTPKTVAVITTGAGTDLRHGRISLTREWDRYELPILIAHGGMCVVDVTDVPVVEGDEVRLNDPDGVCWEVMVPLGAAFDGEFHDPIRDRRLVLDRWRNLALRFRRTDRTLIRVAAQARYTPAQRVHV
jgi:alanine racemase